MQNLIRTAALCLFLLILMPLEALSDSSLDNGIQLAKDGKFREAIITLQYSMKKHSHSEAEMAKNYYYQAYCYYRLNDARDAKAIFLSIKSHYPASPEAQLSSKFLKQMFPGTSEQVFQTSATSKASNVNQNKTNTNESPENDLSASSDNTDSLPATGKFYFAAGDHGHMNVDATVNGRPVKCWFDTGAPGLFFGINQIKQLGIPAPNYDPDTYVSGWAGRKVPAWNMRLTVKLGSITRTLDAKVQAEEYNMMPLIGYSFVQGFEYQIDQSAHCVYMKKGNSNIEANSISTIYDLPCRIIRTKPVIPIEINGHKTPVFVDTGSNSTNFDRATIKSLGIQIPADAPVSSSTGVGGSIVYQTIYADLRLGPIIKKDFPIHVGGEAGNCVGQDLLSGWRYTIDEKKGLLRFFH